MDLKAKLNDINNKLNDFILKYNYNQKSVSTCNEGKKKFINMMYKFIKNINNNDLVKYNMKNNQDLNEEY